MRANVFTAAVQSSVPVRSAAVWPRTKPVKVAVNPGVVVLRTAVALVAVTVSGALLMVNTAVLVVTV